LEKAFVEWFGSGGGCAMLSALSLGVLGSLAARSLVLPR
jgi:hypothetical protein